MQKIKISVVIPAYNESDTIGECLSALMRQTVLPDEIIVVDNNSTDATVELVRRYYPAVRILHEPYQGIIFARNRGFSKATGDIIARIDADTQVAENWIERLHRVFTNPRIAAVGGQVGYYDRPFQRASFAIDMAIRRTFKWSAKHHMLQGCNMAIQASVWKKVRASVCQDIVVHEDMDLGIHLWRNGYYIDYDNKLLAGISARRLDTSLRSFWRYIRRHVTTYRIHGWAGVGGAVALCAVILVVYGINGVYKGMVRCRQAGRSLMAWR